MTKPINANRGFGESIEDIVREMRDNTIPTDYTDTKYPSEVNEMLLGFADRIEAAAKKEREEIKHLRAALEPVLDALVSLEDPLAKGNPKDPIDRWMDASACIYAVWKARKIYNESEVK